jgi:dihydrofolate reductase
VTRASDGGEQLLDCQPRSAQAGPRHRRESTRVRGSIPQLHHGGPARNVARKGNEGQASRGLINRSVSLLAGIIRAMRKIIVFNLVSVDAYYAGADGNIDWHVTDLEFDRYATESAQWYDTILLGRVTYQLFADYWPKALMDPATSKEDRVVAQFLDDARKIVFSKTLTKAEWNKSEVWPEIDREAIEQLKQQDGKDIVVYGSGTIVHQLAKLRLVDQYKLMVSPVILGDGKSMYAGVPHTKLKLLDVRSFDASGNVLLTYGTE